MAADFLEVCESQTPGTFKTCTVVALPLHLLSAVCRSTHLFTSINNFVSQRGSISVSCIVDVDWLKVWVRLVVRGRDEQYRDEHCRDEHCRDVHCRDEHCRDVHYRDEQYRDEHYRDEHYRDGHYRDAQLNRVLLRGFK